ncbi:MAG: hypothetical protein Q8M92_01690, partial [Candidatus Subteraquimicrobiales bacterium]|nr:hypothetical protein [Candidatus Subteraquimicrobiales bacterium]
PAFKPGMNRTPAVVDTYPRKQLSGLHFGWHYLRKLQMISSLETETAINARASALSSLLPSYTRSHAPIRRWVARATSEVLNFRRE